MTFKEFITQFFTWWNSQTLNTRFHIWRHGHFVGEDEFGNRYYRGKGPLIDHSNGTERRWVIYNGEVDFSRVPPGWRGWLTYTHDLSPAEEAYTPREWEMGPKPNMTGTREAYRPAGSILGTGHRPKATGDYEAWKPEG